MTATAGRRVLLCHGWRVRDPMRSIGTLAKPLAALGYQPLLLSYGYTLTKAQTVFRTRKAAHNWAPRTQPGDVVVGHSNGANLAYELSHDADNRAETMVWINPALDADCVPGRSVERVLVLYNPDDWAVKVGDLLPNSIWGRMGACGYLGAGDPFGADPRLTCATHGRGHSDWHDVEAIAATIHAFVDCRPKQLLSA